MADFCSAHKRYSGKRKPITACERCWQLYLWAHPEEALLRAVFLGLDRYGESQYTKGTLTKESRL
jgi:hypothetical protein